MRPGSGNHVGGLPLDVGIQPMEGTLEVPAVERLYRLSNDLHVLLRHRLLREPGGFEGFGAISEVPRPDHQAPWHLKELTERLVYGHAAARPVGLEPSHDEKRVAEVEDLLGLQLEILECFEPDSPQLAIAGMAVKDGSLAGSQQVLSGVKFDPGFKAHHEYLPNPPVTRRVSQWYYPSGLAASHPR